MSAAKRRSPIFADAVDEWKAVQAQWRDLIETQFVQAEEACRGHLLNARGKGARVDAYSLFFGTEARAMAYASEELVEFWRSNPRVPFAVFEKQAHAAQSLCCPECGTEVA